jgi:amino acid adenylation domain-containing protein
MQLQTEDYPKAISASDLEKLRQWNKDIPEGTPRCLHDLVIERAKSQPDTTAICAWDGSFTYGEIDQLSSRLSLLLAEKCVKQGSIVSLCFEKSRWTTIAMLGVLRAGGAFALIDPALPLQRATAMTTLLESSVLLTSRDVKLRLNDLFSSVLYVEDGLFESFSSSRCITSVPKSTPKDLAIVLFTSGSTGAPKAILQDHTCASTTATGLGKSWNIGPETRILQFAAYAFDMSVIDTFMALVNGACLCVPTQEEFAANPRGVIERMQVNFSAVTASVASTYPVGIEKTLRTMVLGGEKVPKALIEIWAEKLNVYNGYGPAEGSVCSFARANPARPTSIGTPLNTLAWVVDPDNHNELVPVGEVGELLIEGPMLAQGYLKDYEKTQTSFIRGPEFLRLVFGLDVKLSRRFYKTGDLVRQYPDGTMDYCGRKDLQTKLRGQRVELSEVEYHVQKALPEGWMVVVDVIDIDSGSLLVVFLRDDQPVQEKTSKDTQVQLLEEESPALEESVMKSLASTLPSFMIPSVLWRVPEIPKSLSGKIDRTRLKRMGVDAHNLRIRQYTSNGSVPRDPYSEILKHLQDQWTSILHLQSTTVAYDADFFSLGGNSLLAMRLVAMLTTEYPSAHISVRDVFANRTLHLQSQLLEMRSRNGIIPELVETDEILPDMQMVKDVCIETGFHEDEIEEVLEATDSQTNMLWAEMTEDRCEVHHCQLNFEPAIDTTRLETAIHSLLSLHSIMRTCFVVLKGTVFQCVLRSVPPSAIQIQDTVSRCTEESTLASYEIGPRRRALHLARFHIQSNTECKTHAVLLRISHCLFDGGYDGGFLHRILIELSALFNNSPIPPPPQFSTRCLSRLAHFPAGLAYWKATLHGATPSRIVAKTSPQDARLLSSVVVRTIPVPSLPVGVTSATLLNAAWALVLSSLLQTPDVVFANITSGRGLPIPDADLILGPCIATIPLRVQIQPGTTTARFLSQVQDRYLSALPHETVGLQTIASQCTDWPRWEDLSSVVNDLSEENFLDALGETVAFTSTTQCHATVSARPGKWVDVAVQTKRVGGEVHARLQFAEEVLPRGVVEELAEMLTKNIRMLCEDGGRTLEPAGRGLVCKGMEFPLAMPLTLSRVTEVERLGSGCGEEEEEVVRKAWGKVFDVDIETDVPLEMRYFDRWPIACAYGLQKFFAEWGYSVTVDQLIRCPSIGEQVELLARMGWSGARTGGSITS